jgi:N-acetylglucosaminyl-diphospho-decaprenol L-rhamnosyltransferase
MSAAALPEVHAVVVTFNSAGHAIACLGALLAQEGVRVRIDVVDNASSDDTVACVRAAFPGVAVDVAPGNLGFARANNRVLARTDAPWVALVNPDTVAPPGTLAACVAALVARPRAGVVGPRQRDGEGRDQVSALPFPGLLNVASEAFGLDRLLGGIPALGPRLPIRRMPGFRADRAARVDWLQGSFLVVRGAALAAAGPLDPAYFMYGEDVEWCRRMKGAGYEAWYLPEPIVTHYGGASAGAAAPALFVESWKGRLRYFRDHRGPAAAALATALTAAAILLRAAFREIQSLGFRVAGRALPAGVAHRRALFRSAAAWVASGMPLASAVPGQPGRASSPE